MSSYPDYITSMQAGCAVLKRVIVEADQPTEPGDQTSCCVVSLSEDLELLRFCNESGSFELGVQDINRVIEFVETDLVLGLLVPADRLVVALEFADETDYSTWAKGLQVLTAGNASVSLDSPENAVSIDSCGQILQEDSSPTSSATPRLSAPPSLPSSSWASYEAADQSTNSSINRAETSALYLEVLAEENARLRAALSARDDTVRDLMSLVQTLIAKQLNQSPILEKSVLEISPRTKIQTDRVLTTLGA